MVTCLVDASPYVFRSYFALPEILGPAGTPVQAIRGFGDFLLRLTVEEQPTHLAIAFDGSLTTSFRNELYPAYKQQRELPPPSLEAQLAGCMELARAFGAPVLVDDRFEADDILATLAERAAGPTLLVTSDKDLAQLVTDEITFYDFAKGERFDPAAVRDKFGVPPTQITDLLGLMGDSVDNIPGVKGVGKKSAGALLSAFAGLDAIYADLGAVAELAVRGAKSLRRKLEEGRAMALLSRQLATVVRDMPLPDVDLRWRGADRAAMDACIERGYARANLAERIPRWA